MIKSFMKKILLALILILLFFVIGCSRQGDSGVNSEDGSSFVSSSESSSEESDSSSKSLQSQSEVENLSFTASTSGVSSTSLSERPDYMKDPENLDPAIALKMREDFQKFLVDKYGRPEVWKLEEIWVQQYFGKVNGYEIAYMGSMLLHTEAIRKVEIAGYVFTFRSGQEVYLYKDSNFYTIKEAYEAGLITKYDVYTIKKLLGTALLNNNQNQ